MLKVVQTKLPLDRAPACATPQQDLTQPLQGEDESPPPDQSGCGRPPPKPSSLLANLFTGRFSRLNWIVRILFAPGIVWHEATHRHDAVRHHLLHPSRVRWSHYFSAIPLRITGKLALRARAANLRAAWLWAVPATFALLVGDLPGWARVLFGYVPAWIAVSNLVAGLSEYLDQIPMIARGHPETDRILATLQPGLPQEQPLKGWEEELAKTVSPDELDEVFLKEALLKEGPLKKEALLKEGLRKFVSGLRQLDGLREPDQIHRIVNRAFVKRGLLARIPPTEELTAELVDRDTGQVVAVRSLMVQTTTRREHELRIMGGWITAKFRDEAFRNKGNRRLLYRWIATEPWFREEFAGWRMTGRVTQDAAKAWKDSGFFNATAKQDQGEVYNLLGIFPKWEQTGTAGPHQMVSSAVGQPKPG